MSVGSLALFFLPESAYPLAIVVLGLGVVVGFVPVSRAVRLILLLAFLPTITIIFGQVLSVLPWYVAAGLLLFTVLSVVRGILELLLGREAAGHVLGGIVLACGGLVFRLLTGIARFVLHSLYRLVVLIARGGRPRPV